MRPSLRKPTRRRRSSAARARAVRSSVPARSAPAKRPAIRRAVDDLRRGREALSDIQGQLDRLMEALRAPEPALDASAPDRLAGAAQRAHQALSSLADLRNLFA